MPEIQLLGFFSRRAGKRELRLGRDFVELEPPDGLNWFVFRVLTDTRSSLAWLDLDHMTMLDVDDMHRALDFRDELEAAARDAVKAKRESGKEEWRPSENS